MLTLQEKYGAGISGLTTNQLQSQSQTWKGMIWGFELLHQGLDVELTEGEDTHLRCRDSETGKFTNKTAYDLLEEGDDHQDDMDWRRLWRLKGPSRGSLLLWLVQQKLKTKELLWRRQIVNSPACELCNTDVESTMHAVRDCTIPKMIWQRLLLDDRKIEFWGQNHPRLWIKQNLDNPRHHNDWAGNWQILFNQTIQALWHCRNHMIFQPSQAPYVWNIARCVLEQKLAILKLSSTRGGIS